MEVVLVAGGDALLEQGRRNWWLMWNQHTPLALRTGEVFYKVGRLDDEMETVLTVYAPPR